MKFIVNGLELSNACSKVVKAVSNKTTNPILEGIKLSVKGDELTLTATDSEISIEKTIKVSTFNEGEILVPGKLFTEYVKKIENEEEIELTKEDIGVVMDEVGIPECLTIKQVGKIMKKTFHNWNNSEYTRLVEKLELPNQKQFREFSRGMKMKLGIAIARPSIRTAMTAINAIIRILFLSTKSP